jgi:hypothetical protein
VIQGSVLGPILFIIFIADLNDHIPIGVKAPKYADGILAWSLDPKMLQQTAWTVENKMLLNKKTMSMTTGKDGGIQPFRIDGEDIARVEQYKYLGVQINNKLNMDSQWKHVSSNFNSTFYLLNTMRQIRFNK